MDEYNYAKEPRRDVFCIDVKSFFASVECVQRGWDPLTKMLVVMSYAENAGGLVLASSPEAKKQLGISNVTRKYALPDHPDLVIVPPRMSLYLSENERINQIYQEYVANEDLHIYSIDESFLDVTASYHLFAESPKALARLIQQRIKRETGLVVTIGIGDNPLLAKLALDNGAKHSPEFIAEWRYQDVPQTVWQIDPITEMWGIGSRMAKRLARIGIETVNDLAHYPVAILRDSLGVIGEQLHAHAWGIDRSRVTQKVAAKEKSFGNSQVLTRDYSRQGEIEIVIREIADQVASRLRKHHCQTECVHLYIGFSKGYQQTRGGFSHQLKIPLTNQSIQLGEYCVQLFRQYWQKQAIRHIGISCSKLSFHGNLQLDLFSDPEEAIRKAQLDELIDRIRQKYGYVALIHANSLLPGGTAISRVNLVGGHAGGMEGLQ